MTPESGTGTDAQNTRGARDSYENIEPWFEQLAALEADDPQRIVLREDVIRRCMPLASNIARKFAGRGESAEDLEQIARVGLVLAVDRFDVSRGSTFLGFAVPTIMGEVRRYFRDSAWSVRVPRRTKETRLRIGPATERLSHTLGRMPTAREIAAELEVEVEEVTQALIASNAYQTQSIDAVLPSDGESESVLLANTLGREEVCYELLEDAMSVRPLIDALPERERQVLIMRYFDGKTQAEIAACIGVSQMQVSRLLSRTLADLRRQALAEPAAVPAA
ncbi:SigB/SigF/SigG family RNA polymerase sigma factor [Nocardia jejuensis]|uniref:SigB/SigF/SigG family RNA polymerase sigma factor n=1 Tax=Nocardia jejuensis TaxID=328049 RepID=UPI00082CD230|nr:SigB/SigF/SigG family RNA polymerase sigma factor [Nocardia jejuensis]